ncbi:PglL family O-oligosaccharyltransferase [Vogesella alkaliphila]|uniref:O-antigen ligase n=1 Tax=Vogesella alkaliphila TaxID=1193621 RepID=A0ABQ2Z1Q4_9NEIS|nr:Wzy polymerase domain-containing protein [Vogesella alkaliphila]GGX99565.1 hypothetical protein GCM10011290_29310 [Vogesella alkaliphila]
MRLSSFTADRLLLLLLSLMLVLPFFNFARYSPAPDWWTNSVVVMLLVPVLLLALWSDVAADEPCSIAVPRLLPLAGLWWCMVFLPAALHRDGGIYSLALSESLAVVLALVAASLLFQLQSRLGRAQLLITLAAVMLGGGLLQALIGIAQLLQVAQLADGWLVYHQSVPLIMGNIAQRNQFAHVLTWGVLAAVYLWLGQHLRSWLAWPAIGLLALVMAWSGGRLPLAYAGSMLLVAVVWYWRGRDRRLLWGLLSAVLLILLMQWGGTWLAQVLTGQSIGSGWDRLGDAGFGARRRIEWQKAWLMISAYPWFGVGLGGYAYHSTWLEAFGGLPKLPESVLFTHSHNLVMQLLAETGIPATLLAAVTVSLCLLPFLQTQHANRENAFLLLLGATILGHSMFEYPLWYLPFLVAFLFVLALSPLPAVNVSVRASLRRLGLSMLLLGCLLYLMFGIPGFFTVTTAQPPRNPVENKQRIEDLLRLSRNPFWAYEAELTLANYLRPSPQDLEIKLQHYEQLARYRPYPMLLCHLAMLRAWHQQPQAAREAMIMAIATYPEALPAMQQTLAVRPEPEILPLKQLVLQAQQAYRQGGGLAAVQSVASRSLSRPLP